MGLFWTMGNNNLGREAAAFWNWATIGNNNNYSREAAAFLKARQNNGTLLDNWE